MTSVFNELRKVALKALLPACSADVTDIRDDDAVAGTLLEAKEGKGGKHARHLAHQCKLLAVQLQELAGLLRPEAHSTLAQPNPPPAGLIGILDAVGM